MGERKQLNVKIPDDLYDKIEITGRQKQEVVADALRLYFSSSSNIDVAKDLEHEKEKVRILEDTVRTLKEQLGWMQNEYSRLNTKLLYPGKPWWAFWRRD